MSGKGAGFERIRGITGYLSKTSAWNEAKQAELKGRVQHSDKETDKPKRRSL